MAVLADRVNVTLYYKLTEECAQRIMVSTGQAPRDVQVITGYLDELHEDLRKRLVDQMLGSAIVLRADHSVAYWADGRYVVEKLPAAEEPFEELTTAVQWYLDTYQPAYIRARAAEKAVEQAAQAKRAAEEEARRQANERARAAEEAREQKWQAEMAAWIKQNGSDRLRLAYERGYNVRGLYVRERAAKEFPGFVPDMDGRADWEERVSPTEEALEVETEAIELAKANGLSEDNVRIVWLTKPPRDMEDVVEEPEEAVVVRGFLDRYDLIKLARA